MIQYVSSLDGITPAKLTGFFEGWKRSVSPEEHLKLLAGSDRIILAIDEETNKVVGFITAITDGVLAGYIPLLEVLPEYRGRSVGTELVRRMIEILGNLYMIDVICDVNLQPFYKRLGLTPCAGMMLRNNTDPTQVKQA